MTKVTEKLSLWKFKYADPTRTVQDQHGISMCMEQPEDANLRRTSDQSKSTHGQMHQASLTRVSASVPGKV